MNSLRLPPHWTQHWTSLDEAFLFVNQLNGTVFRSQAGRKTLRFVKNDKSYFIKLHNGISLKEIFKNLIQGRLPIFGALNEVIAIKNLAYQGFVPELVGYGKKGKFSFVITKELSNTINLEDFCMSWKKSPPSQALKNVFIRKLAEIAKITHDAGINHRDFYLCHFLLETQENHDIDLNHLNIHLIDWHRAQKRKKVPLRWREKDIAGLYFSAMHLPLTRKDLALFRKIYHYPSPQFWKQVEKKARKLFIKIHGKDHGLNQKTLSI